MATTANRYFDDMTQEMTESFAYQSADNFTDIIQDSVQASDDEQLTRNSIINSTADVTNISVDSAGSTSKVLDKFLALSRNLDSERLKSTNTSSTLTSQKSIEEQDQNNTVSTVKNDDYKPENRDESIFNRASSLSPNNGTTVIPDKSTRGLRPKLSSTPPALLYSHSTPINKIGSTSKSSRWATFGAKDTAMDESRNDDTTFNDIFRPSSSSALHHSRMNSYGRKDNFKEFNFKDEDTFINQPVPLAPRPMGFQLPYPYQFNRQEQTEQTETSPSNFQESPPSNLNETSQFNELQPHEVRFTIDEFMSEIFPQLTQGISDKISSQITQNIAGLLPANGDRPHNSLRPKVSDEEKGLNQPAKTHHHDLSSDDEDGLGLKRDGVRTESQGSKNTHPSNISPSTTPPRSSEFDKQMSNMSEIQKLKDEMYKIQRDNRSAVEKLERENLDLKIALNKLEMQAIGELDVSEEEVKDEVPHIKVQHENAQLKREAFQSRKEAESSTERLQELQNEINWLRFENEKHPQSTLEAECKQLKQQNQHLQRQFQQMHKQNETLKKDLSEQVGNEEHVVTRGTLPKEFRRFYDKLQLDKIDSLSKTEVGNQMKRVMLTLLISDYDDLPENCTKYAKFISMAMQFMDDVHEQLYVYTIVKPSYYVKNDDGYEDVDLGSLKQCLDGMVRLLGTL